VEDLSTAKAEMRKSQAAKNRETFAGLRMMEFGRAALVGGVWGVLGLRRRVLVSFFFCWGYVLVVSCRVVFALSLDLCLIPFPGVILVWVEDGMK
jgi:hypothetical protein